MIFCTVGSGRFDQLVKAILSLDKDDTVIQAGNSNVLNEVQIKRNTCDIFDFCSKEEFIEYTTKSSLVITHAGAGTVYDLLERNISFVAVPNLERTDKHQLELCKFLEENNLASVCWDIKDLGDFINFSSNDKFKKYVKEDFFGIDDIVKLC